jgi:hypothetical protein
MIFGLSGDIKFEEVSHEGRVDNERDWVALHRNQSITCLCDGARRTYTEFGFRMKVIFVSQKRN